MLKISFMFFIIVVLTSNTFSQIVWEKNSGNPVIHSWAGSKNDPSNYFYTIEPSILYDSVKNIYHCWFISKTNRHGSRASISYAVSFDGIKWFSYFRNPVLEPTAGSFDELSIYSCSVLKDGEGYKMYYTGRRYDSDKSNPDKYSIGLAISVDGFNWEKYQKNPVVNCSSEPTSWKKRVYYPQVKYDGEKYWMWYSANDGTYDNIAFAISENGKEWSEFSNNPVLGPGKSDAWDATTICISGISNVDSIWYLFYTGINLSISSNKTIGFATSIDGIHWNKYYGNPILSISTPGKWDDYNLGGGTVLFHNNQFHLWYSGVNYNSGVWQIGYATSEYKYTRAALLKSSSISFFQNYPDPFRPLSKIEFNISKNGRVKIVIHDVSGYVIRCLMDEEKEPGAYALNWDGFNNDGILAPDGIYLYSIDILNLGGPSTLEVKKILLIQ
jgi:predicted GH43/DUF377 family glycosyl hydrolase